jgi:hypothetical protein
MATLVLGTLGRIVAGPIGAIVGTLIGSGVDRAVLGGGRTREQGRISNPAVQSASYGEPIPLVVGRMRAAGNLIWTSGIREASSASGGGKRSGPATTSYSYSASFAVALAGRRIMGVERIWADGRLIRDAAGVFASPVIMRIHDGSADQPVDPLVAAAEGLGHTPAYRGLAYAVFEDLPLADYGNRIPNLTFEIVADDGPLDMGDVIARLAATADDCDLPVTGQFPTLAGYIAGRAGSLADTLAPLLAAADAAIVGSDPLVVSGRGGDVMNLPANSFDARRPPDDRPPDRCRRLAADSQPGCLELAFYDTSRDYQPGLQRARRTAAATSAQQSVAAAMSPVEAKALAVDRLHAAQAGRLRRSLRLPWRHIGLSPGSLVALAGESTVWRVREARFENFIVHLDLERNSSAAPWVAAPSVVPLADGGRAFGSMVEPAGETILHVLDLPPVDGAVPAMPRLWIAGAGAATGWRRANVLLNGEGDTDFRNVGQLDGGTVIGSALTALPAGPSWCWDRFSHVDIEVLADRDWLEPRSAAAVLGGANLALLGDELVQFAHAEALAPRRFRLSGLLRGRHGTEAAVAQHGSGERFILIDTARMLTVELPLDRLGRGGLAKPAGAGDADTKPTPFVLTGNALRPLAPVHLRLRRHGGDFALSWIRRSRAGFGWLDFVDAPLGEEREIYRVEVRLDGQSVRQADVANASFVYTAAQRAADGNGTILEFAVAQLGTAIGPGAVATIGTTI